MRQAKTRWELSGFFRNFVTKGMADGQSTLTKKTTKMNKIYADQIEKAKNLAQGIERNADILKKHGIDSDKDNLLALAEKLTEASEKQDAAAAALNDARDEAHQLLAEHKKVFDDSKSPIKKSFSPEEWSKFGLADKR